MKKVIVTVIVALLAANIWMMYRNSSSKSSNSNAVDVSVIDSLENVIDSMENVIADIEITFSPSTQQKSKTQITADFERLMDSYTFTKNDIDEYVKDIGYVDNYAKAAYLSLELINLPLDKRQLPLNQEEIDLLCEHNLKFFYERYINPAGQFYPIWSKDIKNDYRTIKEFTKHY